MNGRTINAVYAAKIPFWHRAEHKVTPAACAPFRFTRLLSEWKELNFRIIFIRCR